MHSYLSFAGTVKVKSSNIQVGDLIIVEKNQRVPADMIFLRTSEKNGTVVGVVLYTGRELRSVMNTSNPRSKIGLFDLEVNCLTKILFGALVVVSLVMVALQHFAGRWYLQIIRFLLLFSNIIPIR
ncbi:hypothetical protein llap_14614 [Limosa lapponica baueri]|uniref:P-type ATPase A domain-containing protein n=1 Tax=Limosa lapponica baueri TaxID=1758121 RepID=A0A2I0TMX0_LIMLA|nr:hypothetical protein llap_14614 [Limosa lapponica baueri]